MSGNVRVLKRSSSLCDNAGQVWNSYMKNVLLAADYEGTLALWDAEAAHCTATYEEHAKRVWSADFSQVRALPASQVVAGFLFLY